MFLFNRDKMQMPTPDKALPGRATPMPVPETHFVNGAHSQPPYPDGDPDRDVRHGLLLGRREDLLERARRRLDGGRLRRRLHAEPDLRGGLLGPTGHAEVVRVVYRPGQGDRYEELLKHFWEEHDPTQGMRQGNDSGHAVPLGDIHLHRRAAATAEASRAAYQQELTKAGYGEITTEIVDAPEFYFAEDYHQQYLAKNPAGYCPNHSTGIACPVGLGVTAQ